jgi:hypothetical protein
MFKDMNICNILCKKNRLKKVSQNAESHLPPYIVSTPGKCKLNLHTTESPQSWISKNFREI